MAELEFGQGQVVAKRGRPKGARNKRSQDLGRYIEAFYGGMTPGQQGAAVSMVTARELRAAKGDLVLAMATKAKALAKVLVCEPLDAWKVMAAERQGLLPYVHQRQAQKVEVKGGGIIPVLMVAGLDERADPAIEGQWTGPDDDELSFLDTKPAQVGRSKSEG